MNSREFEIYKNGKIDSININAAMIIVEQIIKDIDVILKDYDLDKEQIEYLNSRRKRISNFLDKYIPDFSMDNLLSETIQLRNKPSLAPGEQKRLDIITQIQLKKMRGVRSKYNTLIPYLEETLSDPENGEAKALEYYQNFYQELVECFDMEDEIHINIVIPIWKNYIDSVDKDFSQGDRFAYLLHSSNAFINLPGSEGYHINKENGNDVDHKINFISSSLITDKEMETGHTNVGILIKPKRITILTAYSSDCGTVENNQKNVTNIKVNDDGYCVSIAYPRYAMPISKLGTPKKIERDAMQASINNTGEILNAGKWILPIYTEVVIDKNDFELDGIFFKTTGCDINLQDYIVAKQMEMYYGKKLRKVNQSINREKNGLNPYTDEEIERFNDQLQFYNDEENYKMFKDAPVLFRNLIQSYYKEIVCETGFKAETKIKIESTFVKIIEYLNTFIKQSQIEDDSKIKLDDIMNIALDNKSFPLTRYVPENVWGSTEITKKDIGKEFALNIPINLKKKVEDLLLTTNIQFEKKGEEK